jgi:hypothetical protein
MKQVSIDDPEVGHASRNPVPKTDGELNCFEAWIGANWNSY